MSMQCNAFHSFMDWQLEKMTSAINEMKWYASEREHHDVGFHEAEIEFMERFLQGCATSWRKEFCSNVCPMREGCELKKIFLDPPTEP